MDPARRQPPLAYLTGGGTTALHLDARQIEEFLLTAPKPCSVSPRYSPRGSPAGPPGPRLALSAVQFALPGQTARYIRYIPCGAIALAALIRNRRHILPTLTAPFRRAGGDEDQPTAVEAKDVTPAR
jgi:cation:H+ antiporter